MALSWPDFKATPAGTVILNNGYAECVAVVNQLNEDVLGLPFIRIGSASQLWTLRDTEPTLRENYVALPVPVPGAIPVWVGANWNAQHGHTGVVIAVGPDGSFTTLEQNAGPKARDTYQHVRNVNDAGLQGFLVPKNNPAGATPATDTRKGHRLMSFDLFTSGPTTKNTGANVRIMTDYGAGHVPTTQLTGFLLRRRNATLSATPAKTVLDLPDRMLDSEVSAINNFLKTLHAAATAGVEFDAAKFRLAMTDALKELGSDVAVTVDTVIDPDELAAALEIATGRVLKKLAA